MKTIELSTGSRETMIDITAEVAQAVRDSGITDGIAVVYSPHTTSAVTINESADPDVRRDLVRFFHRLVPEDSDFRHAEGNSDAHVKSSMIGCSVTVIVEQSRLVLGTWQGIYFCEFDGPRRRRVTVKTMAG